MRHAALTFAPLALILAGATVPAEAPPDAAVDAALAAVYGHYKADDNALADWELPVFSAAVSAKLAAWSAHVDGDLTNLNDYGWFCECQDRDGKAFAWKRQSLRVLGPGRIEVGVHVEAGWGSASDQRLILVYEDGAWKVDDLFSRTEPDGIRAGIDKELAGKPEG